MVKFRNKFLSFILIIVMILTTSNLHANSSVMKGAETNKQGITSESTDKEIISKIKNNPKYKDTLNKKNKDNVVEGILDDLQSIEDLGILEYGIIDDIEFLNNNPDEVEYTIELNNGIEDKVHVSEITEKRTVYEFEENENSLSNTFIVESDGTMYIDGKKVTSKYEKNTTDAIQSSMQYATVKTVTTCPYGTSSDYTVNAGNKSVPDINLSNDIVRIVCSVFMSVCLSFIPYKALSLVSSAIIGTLASEFWSYCIDTKTHTEDFSFKGYTYYHKNTTGMGYIPSKNKRFIKFKGTFYSKRLYTGTARTKTKYQVISYD